MARGESLLSAMRLAVSHKVRQAPLGRAQVVPCQSYHREDRRLLHLERAHLFRRRKSIRTFWISQPLLSTNLFSCFQADQPEGNPFFATLEDEVAEIEAAVERLQPWNDKESLVRLAKSSGRNVFANLSLEERRAKLSSMVNLEANFFFKVLWIKYFFFYYRWIESSRQFKRRRCAATS